MKIVMMGPQGSGKSTQARLLAERLGVAHISTGSLFRQIAEEDSDLGLKVEKFLSEGKLVPDEETLEIVESFCDLPGCEHGFVLDGFPRNLDQAQRFSQPIDQAFYLKVSDSESVKRLTARGRFDDTSELIRERLRAYHTETEPVLEYYRAKGLLTEIEGENSIEHIQQVIVEKLKGRGL